MQASTRSRRELPAPASAPEAEVPEHVPEPAPAGATTRGRILFVLGLSLVCSSIPELRFRFAGLNTHIYVFIVAFAALGLLFDRRVKRVDLGLHGVGLLFTAVVVITNLLAEDKRDALSICLKWVTVLFTFFIVTRLPQNERDLELAAYGLIAGVAAIGGRGLFLHQQDPTYYLEPMRGIGSRNTFSMWTLAPLLYSFWLVATQQLRQRTKLMLFFAIAAMVIPQALSLSRSGWLLIAATFLLAFLGRRSLRSLLTGLIAATAIYFAVSQLEFLEKAESRFNDLRTGTVSDEFRLSIMKAGLDIFFEHPVFGVSQSDVPYSLGRETRGEMVNSHNLYVEILVGMGLMGVVSLSLCVIVLIQTWRSMARLRSRPASKELGTLLLPLLALGALRALTSEELIYNPSFMMGIAIAFVACRMRIAHEQATLTNAAPVGAAFARQQPVRHARSS